MGEKVAVGVKLRGGRAATCHHGRERFGISAELENTSGNPMRRKHISDLGKMFPRLQVLNTTTSRQVT
jgi:hypothetical protein